MKNIIFSFVICIASINLFAIPFDPPSGSHYFENTSQTISINVDGATHIRLNLNAVAFNLGVTDVYVYDPITYQTYGSVNAYAPNAWQTVTEDDMIVVPNNCEIYISCYGYACTASIQYEALFGGQGNVVTDHQITNNNKPVGLEHNLLFDACNRYTVTKNFGGTIDENQFFDGKLTNVPVTGSISASDPFEITVTGLPNITPTGKCYFGFTSTGNAPTDFIIEGGQLGNMGLLAYETGNTANEYLVEVNNSCETLKITIIETPNSSTIGFSEILFIQPDATSPYEGLFVPAKIDDLSTEGDLEIGGALYQETETGIRISDLNNKMVFQATNTTTEVHASGSGGIEFKNDDNNVIMSILDDGRIGIGTQNPGEKFAVAGIILAEEVLVTADVETYPDYVFSEDYVLMPLSVLEDYISEHGHLPEVPSAKQASEEGMKVGEMNQILLKKIEELTLYILESDKKIEQLSKKVEELQNEDIEITETEKK